VSALAKQTIKTALKSLPGNGEMTGAKGEHFKVQKIAFEICSNIFSSL